MHLKFDKYNDVLIVYLFGELDHHNAEVLRVKIDDRIDREGIKKVILSFQGVSFMDSSGIGAVIGRYKKIKESSINIFIFHLLRKSFIFLLRLSMYKQHS